MNQQPETNLDSAEPVWSRPARIIASVLISVHVFCVFVAPWSQPPPASDLARLCADMFLPYIEAVAIDNGYRFFAPNPGASNLLRYEIDFADGSTKSWRFPDPVRHWPRLWYHRHFMVSESLAAIYGETQAMPAMEEIPKEERLLARKELERAEKLKRSVAKYLLSQHENGERIRMFVQTHEIPTPTEMQGGMRLDDKKLYRDFALAEYSKEML